MTCCCGSPGKTIGNSYSIGCGCDYCSQSCSNPQGECPTIVNRLLEPGITIFTEWNIPVCQGTIAVRVAPGIPLVPRGLLWNPDFGYFEIAQIIDEDTILIRNLCLFAEIPAGTKVPACTPFILTSNPVPPNTDTAIFLASDFTAPGAGSCASVLLTSVAGLVAGMTISIGTAVYYLSDITGFGGSVVICNLGGGFLPGTFVQAIDSFGQYLYPVSVLDTNIFKSLTGQNSGTVTFPNLSDPGHIRTVSTPLFTINNPNVSAPLFVKGWLFGSIKGITILDGFVIQTLSLSDTTSPFSVMLTDSHFNNNNISGKSLSFNVRQTFTLVVPPGDSETLKGNYTIETNLESGASWIVNDGNMKVRVNILGVSA